MTDTKNSEHPFFLQVPISGKMKEEMVNIAEERGMSVSELVRFWLDGSIRYWRET